MKHSLFILLVVFPCFFSLLNGQNSKKTWVFEKKGKNLEITIEQGQYIKVRWQGSSKLMTSKGNLEEISNDSLIIKDNRRNSSIAIKDITRISFKREISFFEETFIYTLIAIGIVIALFSLLFGGMLVSLGSQEKEKYLRNGLAGLGVITLGLVFLQLATRELKISKPLSPTWTLKEIPGNSGGNQP